MDWGERIGQGEKGPGQMIGDGHPLMNGVIHPPARHNGFGPSLASRHLGDVVSQHDGMQAMGQQPGRMHRKDGPFAVSKGRPLTGGQFCGKSITVSAVKTGGRQQPPAQASTGQHGHRCSVRAIMGGHGSGNGPIGRASLNGSAPH